MFSSTPVARSGSASGRWLSVIGTSFRFVMAISGWRQCRLLLCLQMRLEVELRLR